MTKKNFKKMINTIMVLDAMVDAMVLNAIIGGKPAPADNDNDYDEREERLNEREHELDKREYDLDEREGELDEREADIDEREDELDENYSVEREEREHNDFIKDTIFGAIDELISHIANKR